MDMHGIGVLFGPKQRPHQELRYVSLQIFGHYNRHTRCKKMLSYPKKQDKANVFTAVASVVAAAAIVARSIYGARRYFFSNLNFSCRLYSQHTVLIKEYREDDYPNEEFQAVDYYLGAELASSQSRLRVGKDENMKTLVTTVDLNKEIVDVFTNVKLRWRLIFTEAEPSNVRQEKFMRCYELTFDKKHEEVVLNSYLPFILERSKAIKEENKVLKLYPVDSGCEISEYDFEFDHPVTFKNIAMDSELKTAVLADLNTFINAKENYRSAGRPWKRSYLVYGPPGTGKSSLAAAMANYLKFDVYDVDLSGFERLSDQLLFSMPTYMSSRAIIVVEDVDGAIKIENRGLEYDSENDGQEQVTSSALINQIWAECGDGRILVLTTNHIDMVDDEFLRPGLIDMQIHMSYCTVSAFNQLAYNHLEIYHHELFKEIEDLLKEVEVTIAEVAGVLMRSHDPEISLEGLVEFLRSKKAEYDD